MRFLYIIILSLIFSDLSIAQCTDHGNNWEESWTSCSPNKNPNPIREEGHWILFEFDEPHYITTSHIWNANRTGESELGLKEVIVDFSGGDITWKSLGSFTFPMANESADYQGFEGPDFQGRLVEKILITVVNTYSDNACASLGEILFRVDNTQCHGEIDACGNCNGPGPATWYLDADGDGLGSDNSILVSCDQPFGYVDNNGDICDSGELGWDEISPLFQESCNGCHIEASAGGLNLGTYASFSEGGNICGFDLKSGTNLVGVITEPNFGGCISIPEMNARTGNPISQSDLDKIQKWIDGGAPETCIDFCIEDEVVTQHFDKGTVDYILVSEEISSTALIDSMTRIFFDAGMSIDLEDGFEVLRGGEFIAKMDGCN